MRRIVGIDFGRKRVGVALADPLRMFALVHGTFDQAGVLAELRAIDDNDGIETVVVGWPLTLEGTEGVAVKSVETYVRRIQRVLPHVDLVRWDERYSSEEARELLVRAGVPRSQRREKGRLDAAAAAVILQQYLDWKRATHP